MGSNNSEKPPESMHHSGGAASETLYIYTRPFEKFVEIVNILNSNEINIGVVGLGLAYIEISFLQYLQSQMKFFNKINLVSYEKEQDLNEFCEAWLKGSAREMTSVYDLVYSKLAEKRGSSQDSLSFVKSAALGNFSNLQWQRLGELSMSAQNMTKFNYVAYDAFSQYTNSPLWSDEFLDWFLLHMCDTNCVFATYACTGALKRALYRNGFLFIKRRGFSGKRDATLALRGDFKIHQQSFQND